MGARTGFFVNKQSGGMLSLLGMSLSLGNRWFVDSGHASASDAAGYGRNPDAPFATLGYAYSGNYVVANNEDIVHVAAGHTETILAAGGITIDIAGSTIIGHGNGSLRPTITFTTATTATMVVSAANTHIKGLRFVGDIDALAVGIPVTAAYVTIEDCEFIDNGTDNCIDWITVSAAGDSFRCIGCRNDGTATAGNDSFISIGATDDVEIIGLKSNGDFAAANIEFTAAPVDALVRDCILENANAVDVCIEGFAAATGWLVRNYCHIATDAEVTGINTAGAMSLFENYQVNNDGETGLLIGTPSV